MLSGKCKLTAHDHFDKSERLNKVLHESISSRSQTPHLGLGGKDEILALATMGLWL